MYGEFHGVKAFCLALLQLLHGISRLEICVEKTAMYLFCFVQTSDRGATQSCYNNSHHSIEIPQLQAQLKET